MSNPNLFMISFVPLWKTLFDRKISKTEPTKRIGLSKAAMAKLGEEREREI